MIYDNIQPAHNPEIFNTRSVLRPLSNKENIQRASSLCAAHIKPSSLPCSGEIFLGMFFDGTGNNEQNDYLTVANVADRKHSNVVRLYHTHPDDVMDGTTGYYRYYIPGVGTPFPEIGDNGGLWGLGQKTGTAAAWNGEMRLVWGLLQVLNAVNRYVKKSRLIENDLAKDTANVLGGVGSFAWKRNHELKYWVERLKANVLGKAADRPKPELLNISVYGFSRGAAEARAFVNWLYQLCDEKDGGYLLAGVPMRISFLGIFDTVASVGMAGAFTDGLLGAEGRQSWAWNNMQIHKGVESCLHIIAAHEVRSTFPLDSVRVENKYPPNVKEYVYPGAHSDVGGGYHPKAYGKTDALARIPGFEMYCSALAAGVPFYPLSKLKTVVVNALVPTQAAVDIFNAYMSACKVEPAPVEVMMHKHMGHYHTYRYQARNDPANNPGRTNYLSRGFYRRTPDTECLRDTQQHFIAILAGVNEMLDFFMKHWSSTDDYVHHPFVLGLQRIVFSAAIVGTRVGVLDDSQDDGTRDKLANRVYEKVKTWRRWLEDNNSPALVDADAPERDVLSMVEQLTDEPQPAKMVELFDDWVHDSMAGLAKDGVNEFLLNGIGLAKFRRVYFGDDGDKMLHDAARDANERKLKIAHAKRAQKAQWDAEAREYSWTR